MGPSLWAASPQSTKPPTSKRVIPASKPEHKTGNSPLSPSKVGSLPGKTDRFVQGVRESHRAEWSKALKSFHIAKQRMLFRLKKRQRALLFLYLGLSYIHLLQQQRGSNAFEKALLLDACIKLPTTLDLSPQLRALFQKKRRPYRAACLRQKAVNARRVIVRRPTSRPMVSQPWKPKIPEPSRYIPKVAWGFLGVGVLLLGTASVFGGLALWDEIQRNEQPLTSDGTALYLKLDQQARERAAFANIMFGASGVALFTGFTLHISQWIQPPKKTLKKTPRRTTSKLFFHE